MPEHFQIPSPRKRGEGKGEGQTRSLGRPSPSPAALRASASQPCGHFGSLTPYPCPPRLRRALARCAGRGESSDACKLSILPNIQTVRRQIQQAV
jgi:hypothetical protein